MMKKILQVILVCVILISVMTSVSVFASNGTEADSGRPSVVDKTGELSAKQIEEFTNRIISLNEVYKEELLVIVIDDEYYNQQYSSDLMQIAADYYVQENYGYGNKLSGLVVLLRMGASYNHYAILGTGDLEDTFDDDDIDKEYAKVKQYISSGNTEKAVSAAIDGMEDILNNVKDFHIFRKLIISLLIGLAVGGITVLVMKSKLKSVGRQRAAANYVIPGSFNLVESRDLFLYSTVSRTPRADNSSRGGGSSHVSSGGRSFSGGSR